MEKNLVEQNKASIDNKPRNAKLVKTVEKKCGIIMPIATMADYTVDHWQEVKSIIKEAVDLVDDVTFKTEIVSDSDGEINIIHKNIISNIYNSDIVVCDISGRNPNVLFELGMRLTFDKPTILIKDDETDYLFDISSIETLTYPKDLRFSKIVAFKKELAKRLEQSYQKSIRDSSYSPFLGAFGQFKVPALNQTTVSSVEQLLLDELNSIKSEIRTIKKERSDSTLNYSWDERSKEYEMMSEVRVPSSNFSRKQKKLTEEQFKKISIIIYEYLKETGDRRNPVLIKEDIEFQSYLIRNGVDLNSVSTATILNEIKKLL
jgi:hypothetical protein